jgi:hypothetical protein
MCRFKLVFQPDDIASAMGSAWVGVNPLGGPDNLPVLTQDCGSPQELERAIRDLHRELDDVLKVAKVKFASNLKRKDQRLRDCREL